MSVAVLVTLAIIAAAIALGMLKMQRTRLARELARDQIWTRFQAVADEIGGLALVTTDDGHPRLSGLVDGLHVEIDYENYIAFGLEALLGMRCAVPEAALEPDVALWVGEVPALHTRFGRPRPLGDSDHIFDVYTRTEPSASDWWQEKDLHRELAALRGAGVLMSEGQLTVLFDHVDVDSVRTALAIPALIRRGVQRVTIH